MDINVILMAGSVLLQAIIGYEIGDLVVYGLDSMTTRGQAITDAVVILICLLFRFALDRILVRNKKSTGFSPMVLDFVASFFCIVALAITLEMYASETFSVTLAVLVMLVVFAFMYEKDIYLKAGVVEDKEEDPYEQEEDSEKQDIQPEELKNEDEDENNDEDKETEEAEEIEEEEGARAESDLRVYVVEIVRALSYIASVMVGVLALGDIQAEKFGVAYYLILILTAVLAFVLRAVVRGMDALIKEPNDKAKFIGFSATVVLFTVLICFKSLFAGFVFLLGSYLIKVIIPILYENYGTGGTVVVKQNMDVLCRLVTRIFALLLIMIAIWQLSYGAIWETDCLMIIAIAIGAQELLIKQNISN